MWLYTVVWLVCVFSFVVGEGGGAGVVGGVSVIRGHAFRAYRVWVVIGLGFAKGPVNPQSNLL